MLMIQAEPASPETASSDSQSHRASSLSAPQVNGPTLTSTIFCQTQLSVETAPTAALCFIAHSSPCAPVQSHEKLQPPSRPSSALPVATSPRISVIMAAEGAEIKDEQIPPQEEGGDDEVREDSDVEQHQRNRAPAPQATCKTLAD